jgi:hypothetical protein
MTPSESRSPSITPGGTAQPVGRVRGKRGTTPAGACWRRTGRPPPDSGGCSGARVRATPRCRRGAGSRALSRRTASQVARSVRTGPVRPRPCIGVRFAAMSVSVAPNQRRWNGPGRCRGPIDLEVCRLRVGTNASLLGGRCCAAVGGGRAEQLRCVLILRDSRPLGSTDARVAMGVGKQSPDRASEYCT